MFLVTIVFVHKDIIKVTVAAVFPFVSFSSSLNLFALLLLFLCTDLSAQPCQIHLLSQ